MLPAKDASPEGLRDDDESSCSKLSVNDELMPLAHTIPRDAIMKARTKKLEDARAGPLLLAATTRRDYDTCKELIRRLPSCQDFRDDDGMGAFHVAAMIGEEQLVRLYSSAHNISSTCHGNKTALDYAASSHHEEVVRYLLE
jgi:ankyrin repeat protein